jgi:hypothetical protein
MNRAIYVVLNDDKQKHYATNGSKYVLIQSALEQEVDSDPTSHRNARLLKYSIPDGHGHKRVDWWQ